MNSPPVQSSLTPHQRLHCLLQLAFRPFFLLSAGYAIWLLCRWTLTLSGVWPWQSDIALFPWHAHEFQFGFAMPIVLGFLLTAAQTWTGVASIKGYQLLGLVCLWLSARIGMNLDQYGLYVSSIADSAVLVISMIVLLRMVLISKNYRNLVFVPILGVFLTLHLTQLYFLDQSALLLAKKVAYATSWWFVLLISLIGSRVIPFFISKAVDATLTRESKYFTLVCQLLILTLFLQLLFDLPLPINLLYGLCLACHLYRLYLWHHAKIWANPLLWSLWLSYAFLPLAFASLLLVDSYANAMHLINIGFIGSMIMAFTSRVSLGHTGRKMQVNLSMSIAFACVMVSALSRGIFITLIPQYSAQLLILAAVCWLFALCCFLIRYAPILLAPRPDGKPG
ncbi:MAG: NnrS family protein [Oceanospirillaceae bacterium]